jgi:hypothetical protein
VQTTPVDPPVGTAFLVPLRFPPTDLVVPTGGRLRVVLSGPDPDMGGPAVPPPTVTVLHSCEHPSALRFLLPRPRPDLLDVLDGEEPADLGRHGHRPARLRDGAGLATARVCGRPTGR